MFKKVRNIYINVYYNVSKISQRLLTHIFSKLYVTFEIAKKFVQKVRYPKTDFKSKQ